MTKVKRFFKISEVSKILNLTKSSDNKPKNYIIRYWEKEFKQIKPVIINNQRYYSIEQIEKLKLIKELIKNQGMTIKGVKNILNLKINKLDDRVSHSLKTDYYKKHLKEKTTKILNKLKKLKLYGKKNSLKS